ncbi:hypothetical protein NQ315_001366 [Exocentrus adspersus]|uniref:Fibronectin type-III domain-containing protein n=1 Tax=Exocentrus adspersus TaxID=1586481 RepID=A0AAV8WHF8_9CUCU|nr:hypothetical protein NQ315_001366 [Exocentrus adspersus]
MGNQYKGRGDHSTMVYKAAVFAYLLACCTIAAKAQQCIPDPVYDIILTDTTLKWAESTNCNTTHYIVNIRSNGVLEYVYQANDTTLEVSFLSYCRTYTFHVTAIADHIISDETLSTETIGLPAGTNITVSNFTGNQIDQDVLLQWHVDPQYIYCAANYKVLLWAEDAAVPEEINTNQNGYFIINVAQCMNFDVEISVQYLGNEHPVVRFNYTVPEKTNPPTLVEVRQNAISINTTWALQAYSLNRCQVNALHVNGTHFNITIPIMDSPQRPAIELSVPGLRASSMYFFNVTVENVAGISKPFQVAVQTAPIEPELDQEYDDVPESVEVTGLSSNGTLSWTESENCPGTQYDVRIETGTVVEYEYVTDSLSLNVSFLSICRTYHFFVTPVADHVLGRESSIDATVSLPPNTDIVAKNFTCDQVERDVLLLWHVDDSYRYCVGYFNLRVWNEDSEDPESYYVGQNGHLLEHVAQCMSYRFELTSHYNGVNGSVRYFNYTVPPKTSMPSLVEVVQGVLSINTTWSLEKYSINRCNITALYVNGNHFNTTTYPIVDAPQRPDVQIGISGLRADSMYYFNVSTQNTAGVSQAFQVAVQTLPINPSVK